MLFFANKKDLSNAMNISEIIEMLDLNYLNANLWKINASSVVNGDGIHDGFTWLSNILTTTLDD